MKIVKLSALFILFLILFVFSSKHFAQAADPLDELPSDYRRVIVRFKPFVPGVIRDKTVSGVNATSKRKLRLKNTITLRLPERHADMLIKNLNRNLLVDYAEEDYVAQISKTPNDPRFSEQWGLENIDADSAWDTTTGSSDIQIAVADTGVNADHEDLKDKIVLSIDCTRPGCPNYSDNDPHGHGTHVAGIAAGVTNNLIGIAGVNWNAELISVKVLTDSGFGYYSWIADGIVYAVDNGAEIINLSLGSRFSSYTLRNAINYAKSKGVVVVAAAGNNGSGRRYFPAGYSDVIAVAAIDQNDNKASFSNYGSWVDIAAPGVSILSTRNSGYSELSGTSMASPHVAGVLALIMSKYPGNNLEYYKGKLFEGALYTGGTTYWKYGKLNACGAVDCEADGGSPPIVAPTPLPIKTLTPTSTPTPTPSPIFTNTPTPSPTPTPFLTPTPIITPPTPSPRPLPWWCRYVPWHRYCR